MFNIKKWMDIAKKYGAVFENIEFIYENNQVKAIAKENGEVLVKITSALIIPREAIELTENEHYILEPFVKSRELKEMLDEYLDFIFSKERIEYLKRLNEEFVNLPESLKQKLKLFGVYRLINKMSIVEIKDALLGARTLRKDSKPVFMPFIDFLNHSFEKGIPYTVLKDAILVKGKPKSKEIFAIYNSLDVFGFLDTYFFAYESPFAYSVGMGFILDDGLKIRIGRAVAKVKHIEGLKVPDYKLEDKELFLPFVWVGSKYTPRRPFWSFRRVFRELNRDDYLKIYSQIVSFNIKTLAEMLEEANKLTPNLAVEMIKKASTHQLKIIGESFIEDV